MSIKHNMIRLSSANAHNDKDKTFTEGKTIVRTLAKVTQKIKD
jgi:hypothetical protein